jgi:sugar phosphate isomerase/epimerase
MSFEQSRRTFLATAAAALAVPSLTESLAFAGSGGAPQKKQPAPAAGLKLGVASYSLRKFTLDQTLDALKDMNVKYVNFKDVHLPRTDPPETMKANRAKIEGMGFVIMGGGTITWNKNDEAEIRKDFEYAKAYGFPLMVCSPAPETLDTVEKLVKEYNIKAAIHNHGPEDKVYHTPQDVLAHVKGRDARMGCCMDVGHATRGGADIVECVKLLGPRLLDMHTKDLANKTSRESQVEVGKGLLDFPGLFRALLHAKYAGHVGLEYEINEAAPQVGMKESLAYERGVLAALVPRTTTTT